MIQRQPDEAVEAVVEAMTDEPRSRGFFGSAGSRRSDAPGIAAVMIDAFNITQDRISRSRLAGDPPDVMVSPKLQPVGLFEFHRAAECIERGAEAARRAIADVKEIIGASLAAVPADRAQAVAM